MLPIENLSSLSPSVPSLIHHLGTTRPEALITMPVEGGLKNEVEIREGDVEKRLQQSGLLDAYCEALRAVSREPLERFLTDEGVDEQRLYNFVADIMKEIATNNDSSLTSFTQVEREEEGEQHHHLHHHHHHQQQQ